MNVTGWLKKDGKWKVNRIIGVVLVGLAVIVSLTGCFYTPYDPDAMDATLKNASPSLSHLFGTDNFGRDVLSRVMKGAGTTLLVGLAVVSIGAVGGCLMGAFTGYFGGKADLILMRVNDAVAAIPSILLALVFVGVFGSGTVQLVAALGILFIPSFARVVRSGFIVQKELDYVKNARLMGAGHLRIMFVHILPNIKSSLLSALAIGFNNAVLSEAAMSYLSLGVQPPHASLGRMLSEAQPYLFRAPWNAVAPGLMILFSVLGVGLLSLEGGEKHE
ncbi:MAG: ABC transporter permease [Lachnospiraceae bacterium]|nr:ABC transporter permease [Lachnospiraceae bacterium]